MIRITLMLNSFKPHYTITVHKIFLFTFIYSRSSLESQVQFHFNRTRLCRPNINLTTWHSLTSQLLPTTPLKTIRKDDRKVVRFADYIVLRRLYNTIS
jgi:hypothetical protein